MFVIQYVNFYQKPGSSNLIGWKLEVGVAIYSAIGTVYISKVFGCLISWPNLL